MYANMNPRSHQVLEMHALSSFRKVRVSQRLFCISRVEFYLSVTITTYFSVLAFCVSMVKCSCSTSM